MRPWSFRISDAKVPFFSHDAAGPIEAGVCPDIYQKFTFEPENPRNHWIKWLREWWSID